MSLLWRTFSRKINVWSIGALFGSLLLLAPFIAVFAGILQDNAEWSHIAQTVLPQYLINTVILIFGVSLLSLVFAVPTAWLVANFQFPFRNLLNWALVLPLAVPTFAAAFVYYDLLDWLIPLLLFIKKYAGLEASLLAESILRYGVLIVLLSSVLYPYVFIGLRTAFSRDQRVYSEAAQMLCRSPREIFWGISLPLARPMLVGGLSLVIMEVINDYGAVNFFGVPTLTEGIFRTWFGLEDRSSGLLLAIIMLIMVYQLLAFEFWLRKRRRFTEGSQVNSPKQLLTLSKWAGRYATLLCTIPLLVGFIFPVFRFIYWASLSAASYQPAEFFAQAFTSSSLALGASISICLMALFLAYNMELHKSKSIRQLIRVSTLGYAVPSVVTGVGVIVLFGAMDRMDAWCGYSLPFILSGSLLAIGFAYVVRFFSVAYQPLHASMQSVCKSFNEVSALLGRNKWDGLRLIYWPLLKVHLLACAALVFIDITKELPLTLILRPSGFETLATYAYGFAKEGYIYDCALPALLIIGLGVVGLFFINKWIEESFT